MGMSAEKQMAQNKAAFEVYCHKALRKIICRVLVRPGWEYLGGYNGFIGKDPVSILTW